jgi:hypothetical protein
MEARQNAEVVERFRWISGSRVEFLVVGRDAF